MLSRKPPTIGNPARRTYQTVCLKATLRTRTGDLSFTKAQAASAKPITKVVCGSAAATPSSSPGSRDENRPLDDDLRRLIDAWPTLPDPVRAGIAAMVEAARRCEEGG